MRTGAAANLYRTASQGSDVQGLAIATAATFYSDVAQIGRLGGISFQTRFTGTLTGTLTVQVSNKDNPVLATDADWDTFTPAVAITNPAGAAGGQFIQVVDAVGSPCGAARIRMKYVNASGAGSLSAFFAGKA